MTTTTVKLPFHKETKNMLQFQAPDDDKKTAVIPTPPPRRRWLLGGHAGYAVPLGDTNEGASIDRYLSGVIPLGFDAGVWLSERWSLGVSPEFAPGVTAPRERL